MPKWEFLIRRLENQGDILLEIESEQPAWLQALGNEGYSLAGIHGSLWIFQRLKPE